ncbi:MULTISPECIES: YrrS family protein [Bacillus]|uniref:YrrS family protein n=1 Tax=Bacillus TaxID=1386 RepID=UPI000BB6F577|nr:MULTISPECIES: YrrS family protein [Bacillus]
MSYDLGSRYKRTSKKKKANTVLNILIGVVFVAIIFLGSSLFFGKGNNTEQATTEQDQTKIGTEVEENDDETEEKEEPKEEPKEEEELPEEEKESQVTEEPVEEEPATEDEEVVEEDSNDPQVKQVITNSSWAPVGTTQSEPHTSIYDSSHVDWAEKIKAINLALGKSESDYTLWFLGNGGDAHSAIARVTVKGTSEHYRVYLQWVTNQGWKPVKMERTKDQNI